LALVEKIINSLAPFCKESYRNLESILVFEHISQWHSIFYKYNDQKDNIDDDDDDDDDDVDDSDNDINSFCWESIE